VNVLNTRRKNSRSLAADAGNASSRLSRKPER
jgi:hypothetical protein